jgi:hypothetical protein
MQFDIFQVQLLCATPIGNKKQLCTTPQERVTEEKQMN